MLRKVLNEEKLKFKFYHMHWNMINGFEFECTFLKHDLYLTCLFETMWSKFNFDHIASQKYVEHWSYFRKMLNILKSFFDSSDHFGANFCTTRGAQFYCACCALSASNVYLYTIKWALIFKYLYFYRDIYVRKMVKFSANLPQHQFIVYMTFIIYLNHTMRKPFWGIYANIKVAN